MTRIFTSLSFARRARRFWQQRQTRATGAGFSGYLLDESPDCIGRHRFEGEWAETLIWLRLWAVARGRCLDLGCGTGAWLQALAGEFGQADGWDYAPAMAAAARQRLALAGIKNATVRCGDIRSQKGRALYDFIFVGGVLMYTPDAELGPLLKALRRLLKPNGALLLRESTQQGSTWVREGLPLRPGLLARSAPKTAPDYVAIYRSRQELGRRLAAAGLRVIDSRPNRAYKLSDLTEDWLRRLDALSLGALRRHPRLAAAAAEGLHRARLLFLTPEYYLREWKLQNYWFYCAQAGRTSSKLNEP